MPLTDVCQGSTIKVHRCWLVEAADLVSPGPVSLSSVSAQGSVSSTLLVLLGKVLTLGSFCRELGPLHSTTALLPCRLLSFNHDVFLNSEV